jgi:alpha-tubulin suppressor-like RCC1 family protein
MAPPAGTFVQVSSGDFHTCGLRADGTVACWGTNANGQSSPPAGAFIQVAAGRFHSCGVKADGLLVCWGDNASGQIDIIFADRFE